MAIVLDRRRLLCRAGLCHLLRRQRPLRRRGPVHRGWRARSRGQGPVGWLRHVVQRQSVRLARPCGHRPLPRRATRRSAHSRDPVGGHAGGVRQNGGERLRPVGVAVGRTGLQRQRAVHGPRPLCGLRRRRADRACRVDVVRHAPVKVRWLTLGHRSGHRLRQRGYRQVRVRGQCPPSPGASCVRPWREAVLACAGASFCPWSA